MAGDTLPASGLPWIERHLQWLWQSEALRGVAGDLWWKVVVVRNSPRMKKMHHAISVAPRLGVEVVTHPAAVAEKLSDI